VILNAESAGAPVTVITSDNRGGAALATRHLIELGHRRIAYVRGVASFTADPPRIEGFRDACRAAGLAAADTPEVRGDGQVDGGHRAVAELLRSRPGLTGIACYNDVTAIGALRAIREAGLRVPADVSVVGCDDIAAAAWVAPALTTVAQQKAEMGRLAVERLAAILDAPDDPPAPETIRLPMTLRVRESTAPPAAPADRVEPAAV
jgi:DNA-binding LacI/PurR family transcriptional regulator